MSSEAKQLPPDTMELQAFDKIFFKILDGLGKEAIGGAAECTDAVFQLSSNYIDRPAFEALKNFYELYFGDGILDADKDSVNEEVDDLFSKVQDAIAEGKSIDESSIEEDETQKRRRLGLAGVQKQMEGLITLNAGIKGQVLPALSSMQFQDAVSQRIDHVVKGWAMVDKLLLSDEHVDASDLAEDLAKICSSVEETADYYKIVLEKDAPEGQTERSVFLEF